jgi:hypothetical protein
MARIRCKYIGCTFLDDGICIATTIELDPDEGCLTFAQLGDPFDDDDWDDDELDGYEEWDDDDSLNDPVHDGDDY